MTNEEAIAFFKDMNECTYDSTEAIKMAIKALEEQPKTGHWIWCASSHKCSNCGGYVCFSHKKLLKYCPNCGAKMQEVEK